MADDWSVVDGTTEGRIERDKDHDDEKAAKTAQNKN